MGFDEGWIAVFGGIGAIGDGLTVVVHRPLLLSEVSGIGLK